MDNVRGRYQVVTNTSALHVSNVTKTDFTEYNCLVMKQQQCVSSYIVWLILQSEVIYRSVGETAALSCTIADSTDEQSPRWFNRFSTDLELLNQTVPSVDQNYSLVFSSLMLNHSGWYYCKASMIFQDYYLVVCPKFGPPAVELFSEGEEVTLRCRDWRKGGGHVWFIKSHRTEGRIFSVRSKRMSRVSCDYFVLKPEPTSVPEHELTSVPEPQLKCSGPELQLMCSFPEPQRSRLPELQLMNSPPEPSVLCSRPEPSVLCSGPEP
ncbi:uncharacterized protein LOC118495435 [Sander lucioperca]|uniref:uncharacterized protein LOC118495435 n=1 Tax=Sander lucioperca TaxID=283035 RepID=UPI001653B9AC|nr:uncharacterized protein LOC118495435 [Sander lucioperca]